MGCVVAQMTGLQDLTKQCSSKCQGNVDFICATHSLAILRFLCCVVVECGFLFLKRLGSKVSESKTVEHLQGWISYTQNTTYTHPPTKYPGAKMGWHVWLKSLLPNLPTYYSITMVGTQRPTFTYISSPTYPQPKQLIKCYQIGAELYF